MTEPFNFVDLFSGIGGVSLAAEQAGFVVRGHAEINDFCRAVLHKHWPDIPCWGDVNEITAQTFREEGIEPLHCFHASPPCQPFSTHGHRRGEDDTRNLWPTTYRIIQSVRPSAILIENVENVVRMVLDTWLTDLEAADYLAQAFVLPAAAVGAPQLRRRLFVVGYAKEVVEHANRQSSGSSRNTRPGALQTSTTETTGGGRGSLRDESGLSGDTRAPSHQNGFARRSDVESRLGGDTDGFSHWLDRHQWPALMGDAQKAWEPPRLAPDKPMNKYRRHALGNAVVPQQIYPFLLVIRRQLEIMRAMS